MLVWTISLIIPLALVGFAVYLYKESKRNKYYRYVKDAHRRIKQRQFEIEKKFPYELHGGFDNYDLYKDLKQDIYLQAHQVGNPKYDRIARISLENNKSKKKGKKL
jgi:hypothetical protein